MLQGRMRVECSAMGTESLCSFSISFSVFLTFDFVCSCCDSSPTII